MAALRGITLSISAGEYVAVMGPSGSGKSTLMHILGCLDVPTPGPLPAGRRGRRRMDESELADIRNRHIGFVFQQFNLLATLPAWRNVELPLIYAGVGRAERGERAVDALDRVGLGDRVDHRPGELPAASSSGWPWPGPWSSEPALILADEPTGNLDSASTADILTLLDELHAAGRTLVVITHDADVAGAAERTVRMRDGLVVRRHAIRRWPDDWLETCAPASRRSAPTGSARR